MQDEMNTRQSPPEREVRRCQVCEGTEGVMINYGMGTSVLIAHDYCAARWFQKALGAIMFGEFPGNEYRNGEARYAEEILLGKHLPCA